MTKVALKSKTDDVIAETKAKLAETAKEYVPIAKEDDPWTIREAEPAGTVDEAVKMVKDIIGAQTERDIPKCKCGKDMAWRTGNGKNNKPWGHFACTNVPSRKCMEPIWYEVSASGAWAPQKVKW
jgi:Neuraminidase (sialidase)